ncbi:MAG: ATP-binding protein, partial [Verrucomicrobiae bacterium]|nr:ATP-binding protein [Verrucomicrobiae bacterium]
GLTVVSGYVGLRLRRAQRLAAAEQERRVTAERQRIARDMHDDLGAELSRLALRAHNPEPAASLHDARDLLRSLNETVWVVNPSKDSLDSVVNYLETWTRDYFAGASLALALDMPLEVPDLPVSADWRHHILRTVKEACHNILKHARATRVEFALKIAPSGRALELDLRDNGCGFEMEKEKAPGESRNSSRSRLGGNGLGNLRRRAEQLGGSLAITTAPGQGTRVRITVPLPPPR